MNSKSPKSRRGVAAMFLIGTLFFWEPLLASAEESLSQKAQDAGKSVQQSVDKAAKKTGSYLTSDDFHRQMKRITDSISNAIQKGGNWMGQKIDSLSKTDSGKK